MTAVSHLRRLEQAVLRAAQMLEAKQGPKQEIRRMRVMVAASMRWRAKALTPKGAVR